MRSLTGDKCNLALPHDERSLARGFSCRLGTGRSVGPRAKQLLCLQCIVQPSVTHADLQPCTYMAAVLGTLPGCSDIHVYAEPRPLCWCPMTRISRRVDGNVEHCSSSKGRQNLGTDCIGLRHMQYHVF
ncbi:hypothetical protein LIA77_06605 [Sarocladium implicatum]|nr:hypothetical protein LIA77_06605 [Sarocladium implicatum]